MLWIDLETQVRKAMFSFTNLVRVPQAPFTLHAQADLCANLHANALTLLATCVNTPIDNSVFFLCACLLRSTPRYV